MNKIYKLFSALIVTVLYGLSASAQVTIFTDDFTRVGVSPGGTPSVNYTTATGIATYSGVQIAGTDAWSNVAFTSGQLVSWIDGSGASTTVNTFAQTTAPLSTFGAPYNTTLSSNTGLLTWTFNMRTSAAATGFASNQNNAVVVLTGTSAATQNTGNGYAVAFNPATPTAIELVRYTGGITGTVTTVISSTALLAAATNYASVRVTYAPATNTWSIFVRDDGAAAFANPSAGVTTSGGTAVNVTYTGTAMSVFGFYSNYSSTSTPTSGNTNYAYFDNFTVTEACAVLASTGTNTVCPGATTTLSNTTSGGSWSSSNTAAATVGSGTGIVTGVAAGTSIITYAMPYGCPVTIIVSVNAAPAPVTGSLTVCVGLTTALADITPGGTWSINPTTKATINSTTGVVTGVAAGVATASYTVTSTTCSATAVILVNAVPVAVSGANTVCVNATTTYTDASPGGSWSSGNTAIATVNSATGEVFGVAAGTAVISYTLPTTCYAVKTITVNPLPAAIGGAHVVCKALTTPLTDATPLGTWSSQNTFIATVGPSTGIVSGVNAGLTFITYTLPTTCYITTSMNVNAPPTTITGPSVVCEASSIVLANTISGGAWTSNAPTSASIDVNTGVLTGIASGIDTISYTVPACVPAKHVVTVNPIPAPIVGFGSVCVSYTTTLSDATAGGTWSASGSSATISSTGVVSGLTYGSITYVSYTLPTGCYRARPIVVDSLPTPITGTDSVCKSATVTLSNTSPGGIWTSSNGTIASANATTGAITGVNSGIINITYTLVTGCHTQIPFKVIEPLPAAVTITQSPAVTPLCAGTPVTFTAHPVNGGTPTYEWRKFGVHQDTSATFTYTPAHGDYITVTMTVGNICAAPNGVTAGTTMTVYPVAPPTVRISSNYSSFVGSGSAGCSPVSGLSVTKSYTGDTAYLSWSSVSGSLGYEWATSTSPVAPASGTPTTATNVTVMGLDGSKPYYVAVRNRCASGYSDWSTNPLVINYFGQPVTFVADVTFGGPGITYQWYKNGSVISGATDNTYSEHIYQNDTFACIVNSNSPCATTTTAFSNSIIVLSTPLGVTTIAQNEKSLSLFPNPNEGTFTLSGSNITTQLNIEVVDMLGKVVYTGIATPQNGSINTQVTLDKTLANGMYLLRASSATGSEVLHFVVTDQH